MRRERKRGLRIAATTAWLRSTGRTGVGGWPRVVRERRMRSRWEAEVEEEAREEAGETGGTRRARGVHANDRETYLTLDRGGERGKGGQRSEEKEE